MKRVIIYPKGSETRLNCTIPTKDTMRNSGLASRAVTATVGEQNPDLSRPYGLHHDG